MEKEKLVEWKIDDLYRISLVGSPATEEDFLLFNKELINFKTLDNEKRIVSGVAMRPNINIPKKDKNGKLYYGFFSEDTIIQASQNFFKTGSNMNPTNLEHKFGVDGVFVFESWIVEDPEIDKTKTLNFENIIKGDWIVSMKIENDFIWDNYIKTGLIKGFSVEVMVEEDEIFNDVDKILNDVEMSDIDKINLLTKLLK